VQNVSLCTAIDEEGQLSEFELYPNPTNSDVNIEFADLSKKTIEIWDLLGKKIYSTTVYESPSLKINVSSFNKGIYTVVIKGDAITVTKKLIVE
jgi:hypothetical protein